MSKGHSQYGEHEILNQYFSSRKGFLIDIGAADGRTHSNSYDLIKAGWNGILVEPLVHFMKDLRKLYKDNDKVRMYHGAISDFSGKTRIYVWNEGVDSQLSTIDRDQYTRLKASDYFSQMGKFTESYEIDVLTPRELLTTYSVPKNIDFVDIDAEGSDLKILESWPWEEFDVDLFCIEFAVGKELLKSFMELKGYDLYMETRGNHLYRKRLR